jgi:hypothetical protein
MRLWPEKIGRFRPYTAASTETVLLYLSAAAPRLASSKPTPTPARWGLAWFTSPQQNACALEAYMLNFSMYQSGIDFNSPYSDRPFKPLAPLIGLTQSLFGGTWDRKIPSSI